MTSFVEVAERLDYDTMVGMIALLMVAMYILVFTEAIFAFIPCVLAKIINRRKNIKCFMIAILAVTILIAVLIVTLSAIAHSVLQETKEDVDVLYDQSLCVTDVWYASWLNNWHAGMVRNRCGTG